LSEFIRRLQERLRTQKQRVDHPAAQKRANSKEMLEKLLGRLKHWPLAAFEQRSTMTSPTPHTQAITPGLVATSLTYLLIIATAASITYWVLRIAQIPGAPATSNPAVSKGMTLYNNQDGTSAYGLFGSKPLVIDNIFLRGVVITSRSSTGSLDGFAIFEIDGKPTNAISVGENLGKGLTLQSIGDESATLGYEGQKLEFKLSKTSTNPSGSSKK